jgi:hypothetical protein
MPCYCARMKRVLLSLVIGYFIVALATRAQEAAGVMRCDCSSDCWCKTPGLSLFRWVFPRFHRNPEFVAWKNQQLDPSNLA